MKKMTICLLVLAILCALSGCTGAPADSTANAFHDTKVTESASDAQQVEAPEAKPTDEAAPAEAPIASEDVFEEISLVETADFSMKITGIEPDGLFGYTWNVYLENNTDRTLMFSLGEVSVNGIMCDPFWASSVVGGMKSNEDILWMDLDSYGIETPTIIAGNLRIYDDETWEDLYNDNFTVMPYGEDAVTQVSRDAQETDISLLQTDAYTVTITGISTDMWGYNWTLYMENNTESNIMVSVENVSINGVMCDPFWAESISAGMKSNTTMTWYQDFEEYGITQPTIIEGTLRIYDNDTFEDYYMDTFVVTPNGEENVEYALRETQASDQLLMDNEYVSVTYTSLHKDELGSAVMALYIENKTDANIMVSMDDCSMNGYMCDPFWGTSVSANKVSYSDVSWYEDSLSNIGVTNVDEISNISFSLRVYNDDTWEDYAVESISVNP